MCALLRRWERVLRSEEKDRRNKNYSSGGGRGRGPVKSRCLFWLPGHGYGVTHRCLQASDCRAHLCLFWFLLTGPRRLAGTLEKTHSWGQSRCWAAEQAGLGRREGPSPLASLVFQRPYEHSLSLFLLWQEKAVFPPFLFPVALKASEGSLYLGKTVLKK